MVPTALERAVNQALCFGGRWQRLSMTDENLNNSFDEAKRTWSKINKERSNTNQKRLMDKGGYEAIEFQAQWFMECAG